MPASTLPVHGEDLHREDFEKTFAVNLHGTVNCLLPAVRHMKARGHGQIAIVSSVTGYGGLPTSAAYGATKAALINMAESLKFDLDKVGVRLQIINPGFVETAATAKNAFPMPALVSAEVAADRIAEGLKSSGFEITFPKALHLCDEAAQPLALPPLFLAGQQGHGMEDAAAGH